MLNVTAENLHVMTDEGKCQTMRLNKQYFGTYPFPLMAEWFFREKRHRISVVISARVFL